LKIVFALLVRGTERGEINRSCLCVEIHGRKRILFLE
jgi:hypothetical protein